MENSIVLMSLEQFFWLRPFNLFREATAMGVRYHLAAECNGLHVSDAFRFLAKQAS